MLLLRVLVLGVGLVLVVLFFVSAMRVTLLPSYRRDCLVAVAVRAVSRAFGLARHFLPHDTHTALLDYYGPTTLLAVIIVWFTAVLLGYMLMYWSVGEPGLAESLVFSGSSLTTTGFATPTSYPGRLLAISEGAIGLGVVALLITFLPSLQSAIQQREDMVAWLSSRAGSPPSGPALLAWYYAHGEENGLPDLWSAGERWFHALQATHANQPILVTYHSSMPDSSWVAAGGALLDAATLALSVLNPPAQSQAEILVEVGIHALGAIVGVLPRPPAPVSELAVTPAAFATALAQLRTAGAPVTADVESAYTALVSRRASYAPLLALLAQRALAVPPGWPPR